VTERSTLDIAIDDACCRMRAATSLASKLHWARIMVEKKRDRGDFNAIVQPPISDELVDAIARHEAQACVMNLEGERHD
jgi:hypothetical protein